MIKTLHYIDLQSLIFSLLIDNIEEYLSETKSIKQKQNGIDEVQVATNNDVLNL